MKKKGGEIGSRINADPSRETNDNQGGARGDLDVRRGGNGVLREAFGETGVAKVLFVCKSGFVAKTSGGGRLIKEH